MPPDRRSFVEWSKTAGTKPIVWPKAKRPPATMSILLGRLPLTHYPVEIEAGEPRADIGLYHAAIRHPEPFNDGRLTEACRRFLYEAACAAVDHDHHLRWIIWADGPSASCNPINGRRRSPSLGA